MTLISVHLPKTAGTSFGAMLKSRFGPFYRDDYADGGISVSARERCTAAEAAATLIAQQGLDGIDCVHGHFLPAKYLLLARQRELTFVTWMRDPVARLFSHYQYWQESYDAKSSRAHHRQVVEEQWTLEQFCLSERFRNIYSQYLWGFPIERFAFIGISEHYQEDVHEFSSRFLSACAPTQHLNPTKYVRPQPAPSDAFLQKVRDFHSVDMRLYHGALALRQARLDAARHQQPANTIGPPAFEEA